MMLGHVQAIDAGFVGGLGEGDPLVEQGRERTIAMLDVVENPDFHDASAYSDEVRSPQTRSVRWLAEARAANSTSPPWGEVARAQARAGEGVRIYREI